jgi:hypothetical protein
VARVDTAIVGERMPPTDAPDASAGADTTLALAGHPGVGSHALGADGRGDSGVGPARAVPDVHVLSLRAAVHALHQAGFRVLLDSGVPRGQTVPAAGSVAEPEAAVRLGSVP